MKELMKSKPTWSGQPGTEIKGKKLKITGTATNVFVDVLRVIACGHSGFRKHL